MAVKLLAIILCCATLVFCNRDIAFVKIGSYTGNNDSGNRYVKNYFAPKFLRGSWIQARMMCQSYGMEFAGFETNEEYQAVKDMYRKHKHLFTTVHTFIDGMRSETANTVSTTDWWLEGGRKINFTMQFVNGEPNNANERCMSLYDDFLYNDIGCTTMEQTFICQTKKVDFCSF